MSVVCVTPNPALDRLLVVPTLTIGSVHRVERVMENAGGKGLNVVRVVLQLGGDAFAVAPLAGATGRRVSALAADESIIGDWVWLETGETRTCSVVIGGDGSSTVFNEAGPDMSTAWPTLVEALALACASRNPRVVTISGSLPPGVEPTEILRLIEVVPDSVQVWIDTSGPALVAASRAHRCLKVNLDEVQVLLDHPVDRCVELVDVAELVQVGTSAPAIIVTDGARGAAYASDVERFEIRPPRIEEFNATGSGDAFLAALALAFDAGLPARHSVRRAVAAGAANAARVAAGVSSDIVARIEERTTHHTRGTGHG